MDINFSNVEELRERLMPALRLRKRELKKQGYQISEENLWDYLVDNYWKKSIQLSLAQMVDDILNREIKNVAEDII